MTHSLIPAPTDYLSLAVAACGLPVRVVYLPPISERDDDLWIMEYGNSGRLFGYAENATRAYTALRDSMLAKTGRVVDVTT